MQARSGPNALDNTFGPQLKFQKYPSVANTSPAGGFQFFGQVDIDGDSKDLTVALKDLDGVAVFQQRLRARHRVKRPSGAGRLGGERAARTPLSRPAIEGLFQAPHPASRARTCRAYFISIPQICAPSHIFKNTNRSSGT